MQPRLTPGAFEDDIRLSGMAFQETIQSFPRIDGNCLAAELLTQVQPGFILRQAGDRDPRAQNGSYLGDQNAHRSGSKDEDALPGAGPPSFNHGMVGGGGGFAQGGLTARQGVGDLMHQPVIQADVFRESTIGHTAHPPAPRADIVGSGRAAVTLAAGIDAGLPDDPVSGTKVSTPWPTATTFPANSCPMTSGT